MVEEQGDGRRQILSKELIQNYSSMVSLTTSKIFLLVINVS